MKIKKGDRVVVLSGRNAGYTGEVLKAMPKDQKVVVEGVNIAHKHQKPRSAQEQGGIIEMETPIYVCKVQLICPKCDKPTRVAHKFLDDGSKARVCKHCAEVI